MSQLCLQETNILKQVLGNILLVFILKKNDKAFYKAEWVFLTSK